ncbi:hypothetical protein TWF730_008818 [Orbilia blumenaviensis]|uniref:TauD/TfdA-like domain-containing protein n=1 Tax=Orbilia blumenaviensis TaxID=1796055 RepID=A0AAV9V3G4_9PEZI
MSTEPDRAGPEETYTPIYGPYYPPDLNYLLEESKEAYRNTPERPDYPEKTVPPGWPTRLPPSKMVWDAETFPTDNSHIIELTPAEVEEVDAALRLVLELNLPHAQVTKDSFPLPTLGPRLEAGCHSVHFELGLCFVTGIPSDKYTADENLLVLLGISSYFGETRGKQRDDGSRLIHIFHTLSHSLPQNLSPIFNNHAQVFHNDMTTDILCMYCVSAAERGGVNEYASFYRIYNYLAEERPDVIWTLKSEDWPFDTWGYEEGWHWRALLFCVDEDEDGGDGDEEEEEEEEGERTPRASVLNSPVDNRFPEAITEYKEEEEKKKGEGRKRIIASLSPRQLCGSKVHPREAKIPTLTPRQKEALELLESLCQKFSIKHTLSSGSFVFLNNLSILHNRSAYFDGPEKPVERYRHLIRLFLRNEDLAWPTPKGLLLDWGRVFGDFGGEERWTADKERDFRDQQRASIFRVPEGDT